MVRIIGRFFLISSRDFSRDGRSHEAATELTPHAPHYTPSPGGQINPAVTLGLLLAGELSPAQGLVNGAAQGGGCIFGAFLVRCLLPGGSHSTLGTNALAPGVSVGNAATGEIIMTFTLVLVVLETVKNKRSTVRNIAPLAIGFAVFTAHAVLLPIDGCCINPARWFGPAVVSGTWAGYAWVFGVCPYIGAIIAVPFHLFFKSDWDTGKRSGDPLNVAAGMNSITQNSSLMGVDSPKVGGFCLVHVPSL